MFSATRIAAFVSMAALATAATAATGCALDGEDLDDQLSTVEPVALDSNPDGKADSYSMSNFKMVGDANSFLVVGYDHKGRELTRMYGGTDGTSSWATLYGYGTSLSIDLTKKKYSYTDVVSGKVANKSYSVYATNNLSNATKYGASPKLSKQQLQLIQNWEWLAPQVIERTKNDAIKACAAAVVEAVIRIAICVGSGGIWDCIGAVSAVIDAVSTCREAVD